MKRKWLIHLRKSKNLTQEKVAAIAYIDRGYYTQIETGVRNPSFLVAINIANALDFDPALFFQDINEKKNNPTDIPSFFSTKEKGQVLYLYDCYEKYLEHAVTFLFTGLEQVNHSVLIDNPENLIRIQNRVETKQTDIPVEKRRIHLFNKDDFNDSQQRTGLVELIRNFELDKEKFSLRIWIPETDLLSLPDHLHVNTSKVLSITTFNAATISAGDHIKLMRKYPYLMTDNEIVYSPLHNFNNNSIIFPSLFLQGNTY
jgi:transcriptional regulator with XRE-family HTH domain